MSPEPRRAGQEAEAVFLRVLPLVVNDQRRPVAVVSDLVMHYEVNNSHVAKAGDRICYPSEEGGNVVLTKPSRVRLRKRVGDPGSFRGVAFSHAMNSASAG
jgi:hypothetical protein